MIGLTFRIFLSRRFALPSPDATLNKAQAVNFLFYALVTCGSRQIGYIDNRMKTSSPTPDAILQTAFGFWNYSTADFEKWCREVGFKRFEVLHLAGPSSVAIAYK
jgi:hypothetical protein